MKEKAPCTRCGNYEIYLPMCALCQRELWSVVPVKAVLASIQGGKA